MTGQSGADASRRPQATADNAAGRPGNRLFTGFGAADRPGLTAIFLVGPAIIYLLAFAIYPLVYSLSLSFTDLTAADGTGNWVGLKNYYDLVADPMFWNAAMNSAIIVGATVAIEVVLGTALALFFNLQLRGSWIVCGILVLPMLIT